MQDRENLTASDNLDDNINSSNYLILGRLLHDRQQWGEAELAYQNAVNAGLVLSEKDYFKMAQAQFHQQRYDSAINNYKKALEIKHNFAQAYQQMVKAFDKAKRFNPRAYFVNPQLKLVYCRIPKNACTLFTTMLVENSEEFESYSQSSLGPHDYLSSNPKALKLTNYEVLKDQEYFKFTVLRDPLKRLVSGYLDKFAKSKKLEKFARDVVQKVRNEPVDINSKHSITFTQFVEYIVKTDDYDLDPHWRPQHTFLSQGLFEFDLIGQFEQLDRVVEQVEKWIGFPMRKDVSVNVKRGHVTKYGGLDPSKKLNNCYPDELIAMGSFPPANQLYTSELEDLIRLRYSKDIEIYQEQFGTLVERYN